MCLPYQINIRKLNLIQKHTILFYHISLGWHKQKHGVKVEIAGIMIPEERLQRMLQNKLKKYEKYEKCC